MAGSQNSIHKVDYVAGVVVAFSTTGVMSKDDWDQTLEQLRTREPLRGYLGTSVGTVEVSSAQRRAAVTVMTERDRPTAIVTKSRMVMGLATAASWLGAKIKAFSWEQRDQAARFLSVPEADIPAVLAALDALERAATDEEQARAKARAQARAKARAQL
ncbi:hypothetical protein PPSIR1_15040 [Plesiocystis pacifica SIR-1]|uniref:Uncharacterized protein n=1 Tax=Plesiocystis pacifica SIR-1 TaxID=391625 RepID=A6G6D5_9BACT|nr:hypothetical protein [Plesiocystis pacifica]EDM78564.1 hypothetical protein PPSIR1_15040 [Plesiocystis pacifica SIR-1]